MRLSSGESPVTGQLFALLVALAKVEDFAVGVLLHSEEGEVVMDCDASLELEGSNIIFTLSLDSTVLVDVELLDVHLVLTILAVVPFPRLET